VIQGGRNVETMSNISKEEYQKVILHGAQKILQSKIEISSNIDIEKLISEGTKQHYLQAKQAEE